MQRYDLDRVLELGLAGVWAGSGAGAGAGAGAGVRAVC